MKSLKDILLAPHQKEALYADMVKLLEAQIAALSGLKGLALKTTVGVLKSAKPQILERAVAGLMPGLTEALEPLHQQFRTSGDRDFSLFLQKHPDEVIEALLGVTDRRIQNASESSQAVYGKFRVSAVEQCRKALPALARLLSGYLE